MKTVGITGAGGLLGVHLRALIIASNQASNHAKNQASNQANSPEIKILVAHREVFDSESTLLQFLEPLDILIHLSAVNKAEDPADYKKNEKMAEAIVRGLEGLKKQIPIYYSSTIHVHSDTDYGRSKKSAQEKLLQFGEKNQVPVLCEQLPHVFGEWGKPFHNSVVSTFSKQLSTGEIPRVKAGAEVELLHAQVVAKRILNFISKPKAGIVKVAGTQFSVESLLSKMKELIDPYFLEGTIPKIEDKLDLQLFNTIRSFAFPERYPIYPKIFEDPRGYLFESLRTHQSGQVFSSLSFSGVERGNHFHLHKVERFCVLSGSATINLRRLFTDSVWTFQVDGKRPAIIDIPTLCSHNIINSGSEPLITQFWSNEFFDSENPDTYPERVMR